MLCRCSSPSLSTSSSLPTPRNTPNYTTQTIISMRYSVFATAILAPLALTTPFSELSYPQRLATPTFRLTEHRWSY